LWGNVVLALDRQDEQLLNQPTNVIPPQHLQRAGIYARAMAAVDS
jgi:hypothetical protein